jgi:hypothetical protein
MRGKVVDVFCCCDEQLHFRCFVEEKGNKKLGIAVQCYADAEASKLLQQTGVGRDGKEIYNWFL